MFSKVFKVDKKPREIQNQPRPASINEQRPTYYPLLQSSLHGNRKRATVHDTRASSIEQDLDLLELVCRSDSLHKRLDGLQAKYERMDDGMEQIDRETHDCKNEKRNREKSGLFNSTRISKSFEEPEVKKPSFFKRIFGNRLSKSEDDLLDNGFPDETPNVQENGRKHQYKENGGMSVATPPLKERRSASADILSIKDLVVRPPDKRHSCSVEFADLKDRDYLDDCMMPPPPPPPLVDFPSSKGGGLKRKRVIRMYNLDPLDHNNQTMGSSDSCYDSTDSELDVRTRRSSESYHIPHNHMYGSSLDEGHHLQQHCRQHSLQHHHIQQQHSPVHQVGVSDSYGYPQCDVLNSSGRSSRGSYKQAQPPLVNVAPGKLTPTEGEWPRNGVGMMADSCEGEWYGRDGALIREGKWPIIDGGRTVTREGEWRAKADSWSVGEGERTTKEGLLITREGGELISSGREGHGGGGGIGVGGGVVQGGVVGNREGSLRKYDSLQPHTHRHNLRSPDSKEGGGGGGVTSPSHIDIRSDMSKRSGGVFIDEVTDLHDSRDSSPSDGEVTKDGTIRRRYSSIKKKPILCKSTETLSSLPSCGSLKQTPSPMSCTTPMDISDAEKQVDSSDMAAGSETDLSLSRASSSQDLPARLPTAASIQELDHFLSAIIKNLEAQLKSGGSISIKPRPAEVSVGGGTGSLGSEFTKRRRKKRKEETPEIRVQNVTRLRTKKMSECGACNRRWVEPRLLPCLHTVCTPCLHTRAVHIPNSNTTQSNSLHTQTPPGGPFPSPPQPYDGKITHLQSSSPIHTSRRPSQERVLIPSPLPVPATPTVIPPTPNLSPSSPSPSHTRRASSPSLATSGVGTASEGNLSRHWNGHDSTLSRDKNSNRNSSSPIAKGSRTPTSQVNQQITNGNQLSHHHQKPSDHQSKLDAASEDLDSVIELLSNLSPNPNHTSGTTTPRLTVTPTPTPAHTPTESPTITFNDDNTPASTSSTLESKGSSKNKSSRRASGSDSINKGKGKWVVWCHECGYEAQVPSGGVECFPLNYILQKQLVLEALNSSSTTVFCDLCQEDVVAEERCDTCPANLCHLCSRAHTRQRRTTHHKVISLQEARSMGIREVAHTLVCATHGEGEVGWWCRGCHEPLCASCLATLHRGHPTVTIDQEAPIARKNLTSMLDRSSTRMGELLCAVEDLTGAAANVQQRSRTVGDQVNSFIDDYISTLEEHRQTLLRQVRQACERAQRGIVAESQKAGQTASCLRQGCDMTHDLLHHAGDAEALALAPVVTFRLQQLLNEEMRGWAQWERLALLRDHKAGKIKGHRLHGVIADTPAHPPSSRLKLVGDANNLNAGSRVSALVFARDIDGQPITHGGEDVNATVLGRDGNMLCSCSVRDREDGSYEITFSPPTPAAAVLKVTIQDVHVQESPLDIMIVSSTPLNTTAGDTISRERSASVHGRQHTGVYHCCTFCSSGGDKNATCACGASMLGGYLGCGHNHTGHPGKKHWSCCAQTNPNATCTRPPSQYYQVTL